MSITPIDSLVSHDHKVYSYFFHCFFLNLHLFLTFFIFYKRINNREEERKLISFLFWNSFYVFSLAFMPIVMSKTQKDGCLVLVVWVL